MSRVVEESPRHDTIAYTLHGNRYLNITSACTLRCAFCPKFSKVWEVQGYDLRLSDRAGPSAEAIVAAVGEPRAYNEIVFCGLGESTLRWEVVLEVARRLKAEGATIRLNTDGLASLIHGRDVTPEMAGLIDLLSVSMNAHNEALYNRHCRPKREGAYHAMLDFVRRAREHVPEVSVTAIDGLSGVDIAACEAIARRLGVGFRRRVLDVVG